MTQKSKKQIMHWKEETTTSEFVDLRGNPIKRTPYSHPYNYDEYVVWKSNEFDINNYHAAYSDRLWEFDSLKYENCCSKIFKNTGQRFDNGRNHKTINDFLNLYFEKEVKLTAIMQGCNQWNGYPYWIFLYEEE